jgi:hypothetical protein
MALAGNGRRSGNKRRPGLAILLGTMFLAGCVAPNPNWANQAAMKIGKPRPDAIAIREQQTTRLDGVNEPAVLLEATQVLQDLGFNIEESAPRYGLLAGSKERDATETGQVVGQVAATVALAVLGVRYNPVWDTDQVVRVTLTTRPLQNRQTAMRVSFERIVTNTEGASRVELLIGPEFAQGFFAKVRSGLGQGAAK